MIASNSSQRASAGGASARVRLELSVPGEAGEEILPLAQIGGDRLIFDKPVLLPGTAGTVRALIDEHEDCWLVTWPVSDQPRRTVQVQMQPVR